ncbi:hypothetical protein COU60_00900 [Candidatus Pacearchaeota archaeon CG10_big_fil_rev_8_21_14_0_10_34_76]|nr:MAG: hypothetical protein COU60_00900 [Candidatus Pacearchaeota archaeon CG10_big_fil_rev_8_21_14_0_10_34_76]
MKVDVKKIKKSMKEFYSSSKPYLAQLKKHDISVYSKYLNKILQMAPKGAKILDLGSGAGQVANFLSTKGYVVTGVDISPLFVREANKAKKAKFRVMDVTHLDFPKNSFDVVISAETIEHVLEPRKMLFEINKVLRPRGLLFLRYPNRQNKLKQLLTLITKKTRFEITRPNLSKNVFGNDEDLCHKVSTADILVVLRNNHYKILETKPFFWRAGLIIARKP